VDINDIKNPKFLNELTNIDLEKLANDIRLFLISKIYKTGGHLASNLGVIELTIALHKVFDFSVDKLIFDVGHQCYTHKILTGRVNGFDNLRNVEGISGFPSYEESEYDHFETGHSSTSISAMTGFLLANTNINCVSVIGDSAIQNGLALASINYLGSLSNLKGIIIINDNNMAISKNFRNLNEVTSKLNINEFSNSIGFDYIKVEDGHNFEQLITKLDYAKNNKKSIIVHVCTIKGKGLDNELEKIHSIHINKIEDSYTNLIAQCLEEQFSINEKLVLISPAMIYSSGLNKLKERYPSRVLDIGITEENGVVIASALSKMNLVPIFACYSTFLQRAFDQIVHDIIRPNLKVIFLVSNCGIVEYDGSTHQGLLDLGMLYPFDNIIIAHPYTTSQTKEVINFAISENTRPFFLRYENIKIANSDYKMTFNPPNWTYNKLLEDVNFIAYGEVISSLNTNKPIINACFIKPIDVELLKKINNTKLIVYEYAYIKSSLYNELLYCITVNNLNIKLEGRYLTTPFIKHGNRKDLINKYHKLEVK